MSITIKHRCGNQTSWWASDGGGYVHQTSDKRPGSSGKQPTINCSTLMCGEGEASLRRAVRRYLRHVSRHEFICACGECH